MLPFLILIAWPLAIALIVFGNHRFQTKIRSALGRFSFERQDEQVHQAEPKSTPKVLSRRERDRKLAEKLIASLRSEPYESSVSALAMAIVIRARAHDEPLADVIKRIEDALNRVNVSPKEISQ